MEQFLGIHIMAGIVNTPSYRMYEYWVDSTRFDPVADVMSRNWFDTMRNYFHINDNSTMKAHNDPEYDKLFKVRPFLDSTKSSFREIEVEEYSSVDQLIIHCRRCLQQGITKCKTHIIFWSEIAHALLRAEKTITRKRGRSANDSPTLELVNKKKVRNATKVVDDVRYDCVGYWPAHIEKKQRCELCITVYSGVKCVKCQKAFCLTRDKNCFMAYHIKQSKVNIFVPQYVCLKILRCFEFCFRKIKGNFFVPITRNMMCLSSMKITQ